MTQAMIDVNGYEILSVYDEQADRVWVGLASMCDHLGIKASAQIKKLTESELFQGFVKEQDILLVEADRYGGTRESIRHMWFIDVRRLPLWLCSIETGRIKGLRVSGISGLRRISGAVG